MGCLANHPWWHQVNNDWPNIWRKWADLLGLTLFYCSCNSPNVSFIHLTNTCIEILYVFSALLRWESGSHFARSSQLRLRSMKNAPILHHTHILCKADPQLGNTSAAAELPCSICRYISSEISSNARYMGVGAWGEISQGAWVLQANAMWLWWWF